MPVDDDDNIEYQPHVQEIVPSLGGRMEGPSSIVPPSDGIAITYANIAYLRGILDGLIATLKFAQADIEADLDKFSLVITNSLDDAMLRQANEVEWPSSLGTPRLLVTYKYYKMLGIKDTKSAAYIRQRYETAVRDVTGTNGIDLLALIDIIRNEAFLVQSFLDNHMGNMDDSSEYRAAEMLQDWAESATLWTTGIQDIFDARGQGTTPLSADEIAQTTPEDARKAQALFKVKINSLNDELTRHIQSFKKDYAQYADVFYTKFLGPGLTFRLQVGRNIYPTSGLLGQEMYTAASALDSNYTSQLTDMLRRNRIFESHMNDVLQLINMRDTYRGYIHQLADIGQPINRGAQGSTVDQGTTVQEAVAFKEIFDSAGTAVATPPNVFESAHDALDGRLSDTAHPQYILSDGGNVSGNITVAPFKKIDGVDLNLHSHTGNDGSSAISGANIVPGSLTLDSLNTDNRPPTPARLRVDSHTLRSVPSGLTIVDAVLAWEFDVQPSGSLTYEVNISPL